MTNEQSHSRPNGENRVAIVDDDADFRALLGCQVSSLGYVSDMFGSGEELCAALSANLFSVVLLDIGLPGIDGIETMRAVHARTPLLPVVMVTSDDQLERVVECMRSGAYDYLTKPPSLERLEAVLRNAVDKYSLSIQVIQLSREARESTYEGIAGQSEAIRLVFRMMDRVASTDISVLIRGESGTGKELVAQAIHRRSARAKGPFVALNSAAIPESLMEAELFGHEKGAFTGAVSRRHGKIEEADGGTLFLDEIGELPLAMQAKLLRVIQERHFQRIGGHALLQSDFRLIAATHRNLADDVRAGRFREDLYFRIAVFDLEIPPLRDRLGDVALLAAKFLEDYRETAGTSARRLSPEALEILRVYDWPGNVRELQNAIQRALVLCETEEVLSEHLPPRVRARTGHAGKRRGAADLAPLSTHRASSLEQIERNAMEEMILHSHGNVSEAMRLLKMGRNRFYRKLKKYGLIEMVERLRKET